jgi:hypothetical protein
VEYKVTEADVTFDLVISALSQIHQRLYTRGVSPTAFLRANGVDKQAVINLLTNSDDATLMDLAKLSVASRVGFKVTLEE